MVKPKIACYITGGWTECGYMTRFLEKINNNFDYRQRFPQKNIGKKGKTNRVDIKGTTGTDLIKKVYDDLKKHREELRDFKGILIEDDLDDRFFTMEKDKRDYECIEKKNNEIRKEIRKILGIKDISIFFYMRYLK